MLGSLAWTRPGYSLNPDVDVGAHRPRPQFGAWLQLSPALLSFSGPDYVKVQQTVLSRLKKFMPFVLLLSLISTALDVVLVRSDGAGAFDFTVLAFLCFLTFLFVTIHYELPINQDIENWDPDQPPDEWAAIRGRWERWQTVRAWLSVGTLASRSQRCS